jgi:PAS domain S-box-containing protein
MPHIAKSSRRWHSLRWRLPLSIAALITVIVAVVIVVAHREVKQALAEAAGQRAMGASRQIVGILDGLLRPSLAQLRTAAAGPELRAYLADPIAAHDAPADAALRRISSTGPRVITLWDAAGIRRREVVLPAVPTYNGPSTFPPPDTPGLDGIGGLGRFGGGVYIDAAVPVTAADGVARVGTLTIRAPFIINPPGLFARLVGDEAIVGVGNRDGGIWIDLGLTHEERGPPIDLAVDGVSGYAGRDGMHTGALLRIPETPLVVWVDFAERAYAAPARAFLQRMLALGVLFAVAGAILARVLTTQVTDPLMALTGATEAVAAGDYSRRVGTSRPDELGRLGRAFDMMTARVAADVAERERAAQVLQANEDRLRYTLSAARVGTWQMDLATGRLEWSDTMGPLFGRATSELPVLRDEVAAIIHPDDRQEVAECLLREPGDRREHETVFRALQPEGGVRWIAGRSRQIADASGTRRLVGVCFDITEQKRLEQQLQQARKMDAIGKLAGGVAHDFNNMLTVILGFGNDLLESLDAADPRRTHVREILTAAGRAADLTSQLLAFSRQQLVQPVVVDVNAIVGETTVLLKRLIGEHIEMVTTPAPSPVTVRIDPTQLQQIIMNLAINARDAMPAGGRLTIGTAAVELDEAYVAQHPVTPGRYVLVSVSDTGVGLTEDVRAHLFEPFFTTKKRGEGTGLGLATVYGAVKQAGGYVWAYGEPAQGSTFKVYLPRVDGEAVPAGAGPVAEPARATGETVLLVEDEEAVRQLASMILERAGYRVVTAANADEAAEKHLTHAGAIALLLTDVVLPGMSGPELFQRLRIRDPKLKVLYMSGYTDDAVFRTGRLQPGAAFIQKPFTAAGIRRKIQDVLAS